MSHVVNRLELRTDIHAFTDHDSAQQWNQLASQLRLLQKNYPQFTTFSLRPPTGEVSTFSFEAIASTTDGVFDISVEYWPKHPKLGEDGQRHIIKLNHRTNGGERTHFYHANLRLQSVNPMRGSLVFAGMAEDSSELVVEIDMVMGSWKINGQLGQSDIGQRAR